MKNDYQILISQALSFSADPNYGLGLLKNGSFYGHGGTLWGFTSVIFHSNEKNSTIVIYFNCDLETTIHPLSLFQRYAEILYGNDY